MFALFQLVVLGILTYQGYPSNPRNTTVFILRNVFHVYIQRKKPVVTEIFDLD